MGEIEIELGERAEPHPCACCGRVSHTVWGYVHRNGVPTAVYYAGWSEGHPDNGVKFVIGMGRWGEGSSAQDRVALFLHYHVLENGPAFMVINRGDTAFADTEAFLGRALAREEALAHPWIKAVFNIADRIIEDDLRVKEFIEGCGRKP